MSDTTTPALKGLHAFTIVIGASILSLSGTAMTQFAVITWAWQTTRSATVASLVTVFSFASVALCSIFSGALIDRWNLKKSIMTTDAIGLVASGLVLLLYLTNTLQAWHLAVLGCVLGLLEAFQFPAYLASITQMVPQEQRTRANGLFQTSWHIAEIVSAALAGILFALIGLQGILLIDIASFGLIIATVAAVHIPQPVGEQSVGSTLIKEILEGFRYLFSHGALLWTVLVFTSTNVAYGVYQGLFRPFVLVFTNNNEQVLGFTLAALSVGSVVGGAFMAWWKGPKKRIPLIILSWSAMSLLNFVVAGLVRSLWLWLGALAAAGFAGAIALALSFSIWQDTIEEGKQGRVFSIIRLLVQISIPGAAFLASLLTDNVLGPATRPGHPLAQALGGLIGTGSGAAMSLLLVGAGLIFGVLLPLGAFFIPAVRRAEQPVAVVPPVARAEALSLSREE